MRSSLNAKPSLYPSSIASQRTTVPAMRVMLFLSGQRTMVMPGSTSTEEKTPRPP